MAEHQRRFADRLQDMSTALERAVGIASTLQELHEAEMRRAGMRAKVTKVSQQSTQHSIWHSSNSQPPVSLPQQIVEVMPHGEPPGLIDCNLLHEAVQKDGECGNNSTQALPKADDSLRKKHEAHLRNKAREAFVGAAGSGELEAAPEEDRSDPSADKDWTALEQAVVSQQCASAVSAPASQQTSGEDMTETSWLKSEVYLKMDAKCKAQPLSILPVEDMECVKGVAAEPLLHDVSDFEPDSSVNKQASDIDRSPESPYVTSRLRGIWTELHEPVAVVALRCFVDILHYDHNDARNQGAISHVELATLLRVCKFAKLLLLRDIFCRSIKYWVCEPFSPIGPSRFAWHAMCLLFIGYDFFAVPMQVFKIENIPWIEKMEWVLAIFWTLDVYLTFRTGYLVGSRIEMRPRKIAYNYARTWLAIDIIVVIMEWVNRFAVAFGSASLLRSSRAFRTLRLLKLLRASKMHGFANALRDQVTSNVADLCITMVILGGILVLTMHVTACLWYAIGESRDDGWIAHDLYEGKKDRVFWYMASFRWVVAQFNGRTDMDENSNMVERFFTCLVGIVLAVVAQAVFISFITKTMLDLSELVSEKTYRRRVVNEYLVTNRLPAALLWQVKKCLSDYQDANQEVQKEDKVLSILPVHLQADVLAEVRAPVLMQHPFFCAVPAESPFVMRMLCHKVVQAVSACKDEVVFDKHDNCERLLFTDKVTATYGDRRRIDDISEEALRETKSQAHSKKMRSSFQKSGGTETSGSKSGSNQFLMCAHGKKPLIIQMGTWISEAALWTDWKNRGCLISDCHGVLLAISAFKLAEELKKHPRAYALAHLHARTFLSELAQQDHRMISDVPPFEVRVFCPICLKITVESATGLRSTDVGWVDGKSDPYCVCKVIDVKGECVQTAFKTKAVKNSLDPIWSHSAVVFLSWHQSIEFHVYDQDFSSMDEGLGVAHISLEDFNPPTFEGDLNLFTTDGSPAQGRIHVKIQFIEPEKPPLHYLFGKK